MFQRPALEVVHSGSLPFPETQKAPCNCMRAGNHTLCAQEEEEKYEYW